MNEELSKKNSIHKCEYCSMDKIGKECFDFYGKPYIAWRYQCDCIEKINERKELKNQGKSLIDEIHKIKDAGIGKRFYDKTFSNFKKELNPKAYNECLNYVKNFEENIKQGKGLFITGNVGSGKTHLVAAMIDWLARMTKRNKNSIHPVFTTSVDLIAKIKYSFDRKYKDDDTTEELMDDFERCKLLIIDDLGTEKTTDWANELFYKIIDYRYSNLKSLIITTNLTDQELKEKLSERLISRIYEMCKGIKLTSKDYRLEKMEKVIK
ncbi:MAG: ATP-binding protein [Actinobacteria bacterium]|nr:ATP-binding protein [Actinomycetota bacterium]